MNIENMEQEFPKMPQSMRGYDRKRSGKTGKSDTAERLFFPEKSGSGVTGGNVLYLERRFLRVQNYIA